MWVRSNLIRSSRLSSAASGGPNGEPANAGEADDDIIVCSTESVIKVRTKGNGSKPHYTDVTKELLTICWDYEDAGGGGACDERVALFDPTFYDYFWQWNTKGRAHAQLAFIPVENIPTL